MIIIHRHHLLNLNITSEGRKIHVKNHEVGICKKAVLGILKGLAV